MRKKKETLREATRHAVFDWVYSIVEETDERAVKAIIEMNDGEPNTSLSKGIKIYRDALLEVIKENEKDAIGGKNGSSISNAKNESVRN